jgi:hypothetical protein
MPSSPPPDPAERNAIQTWLDDINKEYIKYLKSDECTNQSVLLGTKRVFIRWHLQYPQATLPREWSPEKKAAFYNAKFDAKNNYKLQDNQVYRKANKVHGIMLPAWYCACK